MVQYQEIALPERERRQTERLSASISLMVEMLDTIVPPPPITAETDDISLNGLSIVIKIDTESEHGRLRIQGGEKAQNLVKYLLLDNRRLRLKLNILPDGKGILATGRVKWSHRTLQEESYCMKAGLLIDWMESGYEKAWLEFLRTIQQLMISLGN